MGVSDFIVEGVSDRTSTRQTKANWRKIEIIIGGLLVTNNLVTNILVANNLVTNNLVTNNLVTWQFGN